MFRVSFAGFPINYKVVFWENVFLFNVYNGVFIRSCHKHLLPMTNVIYCRFAAYRGEEGLMAELKRAWRARGGLIRVDVVFFYQNVNK